MRKNPKPQKLCSPSAELIGGNDDLLGLLFPHLPVKSLTRFKSVSKQWCALISSPQFRRRHTLENPSSRIPSGLFLYNSNNFMDQTVYSISRSTSEGKIPLYSDPVDLPDNIPIKLRELLPEKDIMRVVQSCNGLNLFKFNTLYNLMKAYCVRNLVTNQLSLVPLPNLEKSESIVTFCLAFDPLVSPHYKVICAKAASGFSITSKFMIYSSETGQWKETNVTMDGCELKYAKGEYCHGAIYWIVLNDKLSSYRFDIEAENLTEISMPPKDNNGLHFRLFGESYGHLYFVCVRDYAQKILYMYELDQVTMKWFIKHSVHINCLLSSFPQVTGRNQMRYSMHSILSVLKGEEEDDLALVINIFDKVVSYNFKSKKVEVLLSDQLRWMTDWRRVYYGSPPQFVPAYPFIASLCPL